MNDSKNSIHPYHLHIKPISEYTIRIDKHSSPLTAEGICSSCGYAFSPSNIFSIAGWEEAKRTGDCQSCASLKREESESTEDLI